VAKLIYAAITSLDGYLEDADGRFDWATPDDDVLAVINDLERPIGTYLYGRRMYQTMAGWETAAHVSADQPLTLDFAQLWQAAEKVVFSTTLETVTTARTRIERSFDAASIRSLKVSADADLTVGGATLAAQAFDAGLVDECHLFLNPVAVGGGKPALASSTRVRLVLLAEARVGKHVVHLHYRVEPGEDRQPP
jgi:dihydrofolate reductase